MKQTTIILATLAVMISWFCHEATAEELADVPVYHERANYDQRIEFLEQQLAELQHGTSDCSSSGCDCNCCSPGWFATAEFLNWRVERDDLAFAIRDPAGLGVPSGGQEVLELDLGHEDGYRIGLGRRTVDAWELGVKYTHLESSDGRTFAPGGSQVLAVLSSPATGLTNANSVIASSDFQYDVVDLEAGRWFDSGDRLSVLALAGARFASIDHRLRARYDGGAFINGLVDVPTDIDTFGGRIGGALHWNLTPCLSVFGNTALSVSTSKISASRREDNAGVVIINANRTTRPVVPAAELSFGARYYLGGFSIAAGYEWNNWFNLVSPLEFSDSFNGGTLGPAQRDLGLHGLFVNASFAY